MQTQKRPVRNGIEDSEVHKYQLSQMDRAMLAYEVHKISAQLRPGRPLTFAGPWTMTPPSTHRRYLLDGGFPILMVRDAKRFNHLAKLTAWICHCDGYDIKNAIWW